MRRPSDISAMHCGFCGLVGAPDRPLLGGLGVMICGECAREAAKSFADGAPVATAAFEALSEEDLARMLRGVTQQRPQLDRFQSDLVAYMRARGTSWETIGAALGVTRQSAWEKFRHLEA